MSAGTFAAPVLASIPSPTQSVWHLGPLPIRAYALCIVVGILVAILITERRWRARGGGEEQIGDIAAWAVIFGIIGGRLYHVITTPQPYFGQDGRLIDVLKVYEGGLGIWGAVALGCVGVWIGCRRKRIRFAVFADAAAPGLVFAQAIGRWGNYFNNELYGRATDLPWRLRIHDISVETGRAAVDANGDPIVVGYFHPTFLYESLWCVLVGLALLAVDQRYRVGRGRLFALYAVLYSIGRAGIESLRIDEANHILGLRLNLWTCLIVIIGGIAWIVTHPGPRETSPYLDEPAPGEGAEPADAADELEASGDAPTPDTRRADEPTSDKPTSEKPASDEPTADRATADERTPDEPGDADAGAAEPGGEGGIEGARTAPDAAAQPSQGRPAGDTGSR